MSVTQPDVALPLQEAALAATSSWPRRLARVLRTFVDDDDDNARTMAALDRELDRGGRCLRVLDGFRRLASRGRSRRRARDAGDDEMVAA